MSPTDEKPRLPKIEFPPWVWLIVAIGLAAIAYVLRVIHLAILEDD